MINILAEMEALAAELAELTERPVVVNPSDLQPLPAALVELPTLDMADTATLCGEVTLTFNVLAVGPGNGSLAQNAGALKLAQELMQHPGLQLAQPVTYVPYGPGAAMPPVPAYRLQIQRLSKG